MGQPSLPTASFTHHTLLTALLALVLVAALPGSAAAQGFDHEHKAWDALLKRHVVLIDEADARTTRARFHEAGGRLYLLVTSGLDEYGNDLDRVHARLTDSFEPDPA